MIFLNPIYFVVLGIDILLFFLLVRLIQTWKRISWLASLDKIGAQLVEATTSRIGNILKSNKNLTDKGRILFSIIVLTLIKFVLSGFLKVAT